MAIKKLSHRIEALEANQKPINQMKYSIHDLYTEPLKPEIKTLIDRLYDPNRKGHP